MDIIIIIIISSSSSSSSSSNVFLLIYTCTLWKHTLLADFLIYCSL
jgi:hypothetical protein